MELFSKFDICWGYNNIRIRKGNQWKAAFKTCQGLFEPKVMFFGMSNSPASFQHFMNSILEELYEYFEKKGVLEIQRILQNYMDNCGIGTLLKDFNLHIDIIHFLFDLLAHHGLHLKLSKSVFMQPPLQVVLVPPSLSYKPITSASRDCGNISHDPTHDSSCDPSTTCTSHDLSACDPGNLQPCDPGKITYDLSRNWLSTMSPDMMRFGRTSNPLINMWQIMGMINKTCLLNNQ